MNNTLFFYLVLSATFCGFFFCSFLYFSYAHIRVQGREFLAPLLFGFAANIYMISDLIALIYSALIPMINFARFFFILRELTPLLFLTAFPVLLNQNLELKGTLKKINIYMFRIGIVLVIFIVTAALSFPDYFINVTGNGNPDHYPWIFSQHGTGPLFVIRTVMFTAYLIYTVVVFLHTPSTNRRTYSFKNTLIGLIALSYFTFTLIFSILFFSKFSGFGHILLHNFSIGILFFIIFISFGTIDRFIDNTTQLTKYKKDLKRMIYYDNMLDIPGRNGFLTDLQSELDEIQIKSGNFSLVFIDIDDFQRFNECYGESVGDEILKKFSTRLIEFFSSGGSLYRLGGDEFVFLSKNIKTEKDAVDFAGKIISSLRNSFNVSWNEYLITASIGILQIPRDGSDIETILSGAYSVIRKAKKSKNAFAVFSSELIDLTLNKINIVNILRSSISKDEFTLFYQPVVDAQGKIKYAEALIRYNGMNHPAIGTPGTFIPYLEDAGLMKDIDDMVIRKAFHDMEARINSKFSISINLSTNQLTNTAYSDFLSSFAAQHGINNNQIILEVTENKLIENLSSGSESLMRLKKDGFQIALDDFGRGFSSLAYLAELPLDIIKIDMMFIQSIPGNAKKEAIIRQIIEMGHSLNLIVAAEGFETLSQIDFFKKYECDLYQGYYFSHPKPLNELLDEFSGQL